MKRARKERGQILILVLVVMVFGVLVVTPLLAYVDISLRLFHRSEHRAAAYYAADAGVERVIGDLFQSKNILAEGYYVTSNGPIKGYTFNATASLPQGEAPPPPETEVYLDPGGCFGMRPIAADGAWNYTIVLPQGQSLKVNWAAFVPDGTGTEHCQGEIQLWRLADYNLIISSGYSGDLEDGDEGRAVAITLDIPGWYITEQGHYNITYKNNSYRSNGVNTSADIWAKCFAGAGDDDHTFTGSITENAANFIGAAGNITILAFNEDEGDGPKDINSNPIFCDYVEVTITTNTSENTYTFENITPGNGPHYSYDGKLTIGGYATITERLPAGASQLDNAGYDAIEAFEGIRHIVDPPAPENQNTCLWHEFYIDENPADVTRIDVRWEGYQAIASEAPKSADDDQLYLLIWQYGGSGSNQYQVLDNRIQDAGYTWVRVYQGAAVDYIITSTAYAEGDPDTKVLTITSYVRQVPGATVWWEDQTIQLLSWNISQ